ncbi:MAG: ABC transporter ATP-binding protein [Marmoricola sp.]
MLAVESINCSYGPIRALRDMSLQAHDGAVVAILGANGAGKSTTLKAIAGLVRPTQGQVSYNDRRITRLGPEARLALGIALCPEGRRIFPDFTVAENLRVGGHRVRGRELGPRMDGAMDLFPPLRGRLKQTAGSLSGGEQQMLAIARALMTEPSLLLLDEPSLGLAPLLARQVFDAIDGIRNQGTTVVLVEQSRLALRFADYAYVLGNGRLLLEGPAEKVQDDERLRSAYLG